MAGTFGALFSKIAGRGRHERQLPQNIQDYLAGDFHLRPEDLALLRWVGRKELFGGERANLVRIFNGAKAHEEGVVVNSFDDLDNHPDLVLFEGHVFEGRAMSLEKKVPKKKEEESRQRLD